MNNLTINFVNPSHNSVQAPFLRVVMLIDIFVGVSGSKTGACTRAVLGNVKRTAKCVNIRMQK
jgi:hypothetical protein